MKGRWQFFQHRWAANRRYIRFAGYCFLILVTLLITILFPIDQLNFVLTLYALPTFLASFILSPNSSLLFALLSTSGYTIAHIIALAWGQSPPVYNYISITCLCLLGIASWLVALRLKRVISNAKEVETMYRRQALAFETMFDGVILTDRNGAILDWNPGAERMFGYSKEEVLAQSPTLIHRPEDIPNLQFRIMQGVRQNGQWKGEINFVRKNGTEGICEAIIVPLRDENGEIISTIGVNRDITERKRTEKALVESEERFRKMAENILDGVRIIEGDEVTYLNERICHILGYTKEELHDISTLELAAPEEKEKIEMVLTNIDVNGVYPEELVFWIVRKDGTKCCIQNRYAMNIENSEITGHYVFTTDITEAKQALDALKVSEEFNRTVIENAPLGISVRGPTGQLLGYNETWKKIWAIPEEEISRDLLRQREKLTFDDRDSYLGQWQPEVRRVYQEGGILHIPEMKTRVFRAGAALWVSQYFYAIKNIEGDVDRVVILTEDITERKQREREIQGVATISTALRVAQTRIEMLPILLDQLSDLLNIVNAIIVTRNLISNEYIVEVARGEWSKLSNMQISPGEGIFGKVLMDGEFHLCENIREEPLLFQSLFGDHNVAFAGIPLVSQEEIVGMLGVGRDVAFSPADVQVLTAIASISANALHRASLYEKTRRNAEQLKTVNTIGRTMVESLELHQIYERLTFGIYDLLPDITSVITSLYNPERNTIDCVYASDDGNPVDPAEIPSITISLSERSPHSEIIRNLHPVIINDLNPIDKQRKKNTLINERLPQAALYVPMLSKGQALGFLQIQSHTRNRFSQDDADIMSLVAHSAAISIENARLFAETQRRLQRLTALRTIDMAIKASMDLRVTLNILLEQIVTHLHLDAADVLLFNPHTQMLDYAAHHTFRGDAIKLTHIRLGKGLVGRAALERQTLHIPSLATEKHKVPSYWLTEEGFETYWAIPLTAKGKLKGVLEIFLRSPFEPDAEWLEFMDTLAGQAAIAIDNATLFAELQRSNLELTLAYDTTLEGWSRALDLRDRDTEGHTQRVTELSVRLAKVMRLSEREIAHLRRGALLHDIGKMGIPDQILHKPGPLSQEEQEIMRRHTVYAYEMLSPIEYLSQAIEIPYCHHEKWDGSGYPRGLKGEEIPIGARIFTIADVWDSLRSNRPYRVSWPAEKVIEHIQDQAGIYFDPRIVEVFLQSKVWDW